MYSLVLAKFVGGLRLLNRRFGRLLGTLRLGCRQDLLRLGCRQDLLLLGCRQDLLLLGRRRDFLFRCFLRAGLYIYGGWCRRRRWLDGERWPVDRRDHRG